MSAPAVLGMVLKGYPRISETFISNEIRLLESLGFEIRILSMRQPRESFSHASVKDIRAKVDYLPEELSGHLAGLLADAARAAWLNPAGFLRALLHLARRLAKTRKVTSLKHFLQGARLAGRILPNSGVTHLHAHFAHSPASVTWFASLMTGLPFSFTAHAKDVWTQDQQSLSEKLAAAKFVVTCTEANRRYLESLNRNHTPVTTVYHGIDWRQFSPKAEARTPKPPYRILSVARLTAKKGLDTVLRALAQLKEQGVDFEYVLVGDGEERAQHLELIERLGLTPVCRWLGTQTHEEVVKLYDWADVFVLGCRVAANGDRDGIPNVLAEAMAMGVPVVATMISGIPELVEDGRTGLLVEPDDIDGLARAILRLASDHELRSRLIPAAQAKIRADFDNRVLTQRLAEVYRAQGLGPGR